jgi:putative ABC transport system ATP-binding protein
MHQAASLGDRLIMMHRGQIIHDFQGAEKRRLRPDDLLARFEEVRRAEQLDESAAEMLSKQYIWALSLPVPRVTRSSFSGAIIAADPWL